LLEASSPAYRRSRGPHESKPGAPFRRLNPSSVCAI